MKEYVNQSLLHTKYVISLYFPLARVAASPLLEPGMICLGIIIWSDDFLNTVNHIKNMEST